MTAAAGTARSKHLALAVHTHFLLVEVLILTLNYFIRIFELQSIVCITLLDKAINILSKV